MSQMFYECSSLIDLNLNSFATYNITNMDKMFGRCYDELKSKITNKYKKFKKQAFRDKSSVKKQLLI